MDRTKIFSKVLDILGKGLSLGFIFITYTITLRPTIEHTMGLYSLGFADGSLLSFLITFIPLAYLYLSEKEKKRKKTKQKF
jgi:hypothetical protein